MKKTAIIFFILLAETSFGQFLVTPIIGINSTKLKMNDFSYTNGGNFLTYGLELEYGLKPKRHGSTHVSFLAGAYYLENGFYDMYEFSFPGLNYYTSQTTDLATSYLQIPLMLKLNWQPMPLIEDWNLFLGVGISQNILLNSRLAEKSTKVTRSNDIFAPPNTVQYSDSQDISSLGVQTSQFARIEIGMRYKRMLVSYRFSLSLQDMYYDGLENVWKIPAKESNYISAHATQGKITEKHSEFVLGFRLF